MRGRATDERLGDCQDSSRGCAAGGLTAGLLGIAAAALLVNLLAGGGINFASVAGSLWLLAALCLVSREGWRGLPLSVAAAVCAAAVCLGATFYFTVYGPVLACNAELDLATIEPQRAEAHLAAAAVADPLNAEPLKLLAMLEWNFLAAASVDGYLRSIHRPRSTRRRGSIPIDAAHGVEGGHLPGSASRTRARARPLELAVAAYRRATGPLPERRARARQAGDCNCPRRAKPTRPRTKPPRGACVK